MSRDDLARALYRVTLYRAHPERAWPYQRDAIALADEVERLRALLARRAATSDSTMQTDGEDMVSPAYWRGHDAAAHGVAERWREALENPIPSPGVMYEPLESLYRRTEALRVSLALEQVRKRSSE